MNLSQNKFKVILTAVGIIVGSATIMMVLAIGTGGKLEVAEQFKNLNAGAIDISYESGVWVIRWQLWRRTRWRGNVWWRWYAIRWRNAKL